MGLLDRFIGKVDSAQPAAPLPSKKKVLIAEADGTLRASFIQVLQKEFDVLAVDNGSKGLNSVLNFFPDVFLIDLELPVMDGKIMLHSIRALPAFKTTPVIVVSQTMDSETMTQVKTYDNANVMLLKANATPEEIYKNVKMLTLEQ